ncbi:MAG: hypothetical protein ACLPZR_28735 [Solirubrobacteraceae bacterium]
MSGSLRGEDRGGVAGGPGERSGSPDGRASESSAERGSGSSAEQESALLRAGVTVTQRLVSASVRVARVWRKLSRERRLAAVAAIALFFTLFLDWYQETVITNGDKSLRQVSVSLTGWGAFSFVEAAVLLVAAGVLGLLFARAEGRAFHVPGGDGGVITAAGLWTCLLIIWRIFDKQGTTGHGQYDTTFGVEWGIFAALGVGGLLTYAGTRIRLAHEPEPPLPGESAASAGPGPTAPPRSRRPQTATAPSGTERQAGSGADVDLDDTRARPSVMSAGARPASDPAAARPASDPAAARPAVEPPSRRTAAEPTPAGGRTRKRPRSVGAPADSARPATARPAAAQSATARPATARPATARPATAQSAAAQSAADDADHRVAPADSEPTVRRGTHAAPQPSATPAPPDPSEEPTQVVAHDQLRAGRIHEGSPPGRPRPARTLDPAEIAELDLADPPAPRLGRSRPSSAPSRGRAAETGDADDQLTLRFDRPR